MIIFRYQRHKYHKGKYHRGSRKENGHMLSACGDQFLSREVIPLGESEQLPIRMLCGNCFSVRNTKVTAFANSRIVE